MTDDDLDLLASAYVDGEATSEEVALVEGDPELLARVAELRAISEQVSATPPPPNAALKQQHLAAAMAEFSAQSPQTQGLESQSPQSQSPQSQSPRSQSTVPSLAEKRRDREARKAERSMPQWLSAAAAFILIGGGAIFVAGQLGGSDDESAETATAEIAEDAADDDDTADDTANFAADDAAGSSAARTESAMEESDAMASDSPQESALDESAMEDSAMDDDAMDDDAMEESEVVPDEEAGEQSPSPSTTTTGGFFPGEPVREYDEIPEIEGLLADLPEPRTDLLESRCGLQLDGQLDLELVGYLPITIGGVPAEVFAVLTQDGSDSAIVVDEGCEQLAP